MGGEECIDSYNYQCHSTEELGRLGVEQQRSQVAASARSACRPGEKGQQRNERYKIKNRNIRGPFYGNQGRTRVRR